MNKKDGYPGGAERGERLYKVAFDLPEQVASWAPAHVERLWASKTTVKFEVEIRNVPFYVKGISFGDVVRVRPDMERRELVFVSLVSHSGSSTVRLIMKVDEARDDVASLLRRFQCSWEVDSTGYLWAVDIPGDVDYSAMRSVLVKMSAEGKIGIEEAALSVVHQDVLR